MTSGGGVIPKEGCSYIQIKPTLADFDQNLSWVQISCVKQINIPPPRKIFTAAIHHHHHRHPSITISITISITTYRSCLVGELRTL
jgi:hypothetical protein